MTTAHPHANSMKLYAEDAEHTARPWRLWEQRYPSNNWKNCQTHPTWLPTHEYRRKPKTITVNGIEVPEPLREAPEVGTTCYMPCLTTVIYPTEIVWEEDHECYQLLKRGLLYLKSAHAEALTRAILNGTKE